MKNKENRIISVWSMVSLLVIFSFPICSSIVLKTGPDFLMLMKGTLPMVVALYPAAIASVFVYIPLIGKAGAYLSFLTGNISNIRLPCAINAIGQLNKKAAEEEKNSISTLSVAASALTSTFIISFSLLYYNQVGDFFQTSGAIFKPIFQQVLPALFGAVAYTYIKKEKIIFSTILLVLLGILLFKGNAGMSLLIAASFIVAIFLSYLMKSVAVKKRREDYEETYSGN